METMDDPFIPQRGRRALKLIHSKGQPATKTAANKSWNSKNDVVKGQRMVANNAFFLPLGHPKEGRDVVGGDGGEVWKRQPF